MGCGWQLFTQYGGGLWYFKGGNPAKIRIILKKDYNSLK
jgi:hypothetical protein